MYPQLIGIDGAAAGLQICLEREETSVGRHPDNSVCIRDHSVSRSHCLIRRRDERYFLSDLKSNNGTFLNGELIGEERSLTNGDRISVGGAVLRFVIGEPDYEELADDNQALQAKTVVIDREETSRICSAGFSPMQKSLDRTPQMLQALCGIGNLLSSLQRVESVQNQLFQLLSEVIPAEAGALLLLGYGGDQPILVYAWGRGDQRMTEARISRTITNRVLDAGAAVLTVGSAERTDVPASVLARQVTSILCVPLVVRGQIHGAIYLETTHPIRTFDEQDLKLLTAISGYAALAVDHSRKIEGLERENGRLRSEVGIQHTMVGGTAAMNEVYNRIRKLSRSDATVLIVGESGTGKELVARAIHTNSARVAHPFEAVNCALLRQELLESELFGHEKGSFTGAVAQKKGKLEVADGGTVFLDEVGELGEAPQSMLLRVLQEREFTRVGGTHPITVDVRLIAATNRDLEKAAAEKTFREDLYYRLNVICLRLPPLRERRNDIPELAHHFLEASVRRNKRAVSGIAPKAMAALMKYPFPGNVRELQNAIEYAVVFGATDEIVLEDLPEKIVSGSDVGSSYTGAYHQALRRAREQIVLGALKRANFDYGAAAKELQLHVTNLHRLIRELDLKGKFVRGS